MSTLAKDAEILSELACKLATFCKSQEDDLAARFKLAPSEFRFLKLYASMGAVLTIKDFRKVLDLTPGRMTHIITSLERKKFVKRKSQRADKRFVSILLTPKVEPLIATMKKEGSQMYKGLLDKIDASSREIMVKSLTEVVSKL
ncbi:MAG: MarR family transcriptional regulator [Ignavibacteriales bacterium]|jgi:DNA-binding MarR family transcriptional regulator|nr:MarR family transcriptional regulator [Ignavibacteriales bacterium]HOJ18490.1 MarR family transcriptional regulator [Ignavibacteriaceae bacterium]HPO56837.1 MarR family transcriptional regulator [Ignavibacteriaceae bacterium]